MDQSSKVEFPIIDEQLVNKLSVNLDCNLLDYTDGLIITFY